MQAQVFAACAVACGQKLVQTVTKSEKVGSFAAPIFGRRFPASKMEVKSFYKKKLKGNRGRLHFW